MVPSQPRTVRPQSCPNGPALTVASVLGSDISLANAAVDAVAGHLGQLLFVSAPLPFPWTDYYRDDLGDRPVRRILALRGATDTSRLAAVKRTTCRLEVALGRPGRPRPVNIDPGVLDEHQLVLASTKQRGHRIYLGQGIYADLMLLRRQDGFGPLPWTYPDYADADVCRIFDGLRSLVVALRRSTRNGATTGGKQCTR